MPTYDYSCSECAWCGALRSTIRDRDDPERRCPECEAPVTRDTIPKSQPTMKHNWGMWNH